VVIIAATGDPRHEIAQTLIRGWIAAGEDLHAPLLCRYEVANSLTRLLIANVFPRERLGTVLDVIAAIPITDHPLEDDRHVISIALGLGRQSAYDVAYLALAERLDARLWTFDGPLFRNADRAGFPVHLAGNS
jgi:predicted nucleic acid-binding protein